VTVDGRLGANGVAEVERVVVELSGPVCLDLAGLRSADEAGLGVLRALLARGVVVIGASPYFRLLLGVKDQGQPRQSPSRPGGPRRNRERGSPKSNNQGEDT
jgi:hypothetical protein